MVPNLECKLTVYEVTGSAKSGGDFSGPIVVRGVRNVVLNPHLPELNRLNEHYEGFLGIQCQQHGDSLEYRMIAEGFGKGMDIPQGTQVIIAHKRGPYIDEEDYYEVASGVTTANGMALSKNKAMKAFTDFDEEKAAYFAEILGLIKRRDVSLTENGELFDQAIDDLRPRLLDSIGRCGNIGELDIYLHDGNVYVTDKFGHVICSEDKGRELPLEPTYQIVDGKDLHVKRVSMEGNIYVTVPNEVQRLGSVPENVLNNVVSGFELEKFKAKRRRKELRESKNILLETTEARCERDIKSLPLPQFEDSLKKAINSKTL